MKSVFRGNQLTRIFRQTAPAVLATLAFLALSLVAGCINGKKLNATAALQSLKGSGSGSGSGSGGGGSSAQIFVSPSPINIPKNGLDSSGQAHTLTLSASGPDVGTGVSWEIASGTSANIDPSTGKITPNVDATGPVTVFARSQNNSSKYGQATVTVFEPLSVSMDYDVISYNDDNFGNKNHTFIKVTRSQGAATATILSGATGGLVDCSVSGNTDPSLCPGGDSTTQYFRFDAPDSKHVDSSVPSIVQIKITAPLASSIEPGQTEVSRTVKIFINPRLLLDTEGSQTVVSVGETMQFVTTNGAGAISYKIRSGLGRIGSTSGLYTAPTGISLSNNKFTVTATDSLGNWTTKSGTIIDGMTFFPGIAVSQPNVTKTIDLKVMGGEPASDGSYNLTFTDNYSGTGALTLAQYNALGRGTFSPPQAFKGDANNAPYYGFNFKVPETIAADPASLRITVTASEPAHPEHSRTTQIIVSQKMDVIQPSVDGLRFGETADAEYEGAKRTRIFDVVGGTPPYIVKPCSDKPESTTDLSYYLTVTQLSDTQYGSRFKVDGSRLNIKDFRDAILPGKKPWIGKVGKICFWDQSTWKVGDPVMRPVTIEQGPIVIPSKGNKRVTSMVTDTSGNMFLSGWIDKGGSINGVLADPVHRSGFIMRVNLDGRLAWVRMLKDNDTAVTNQGAGKPVAKGNREIAQIRLSRTTSNSTAYVFFVGNTMPADGTAEIGLLGRVDAASGGLGTGGVSEFSLSEHRATNGTNVETVDINPSDLLRTNTRDSAGREINFLKTNTEPRGGLFFTKDEATGDVPKVSTRIAKSVHFASLAVYPLDLGRAPRIYVTGKMTSVADVYAVESFTKSDNTVHYKIAHSTPNGPATLTDAFVAAFNFDRAANGFKVRTAYYSSGMRKLAGHDQQLLKSTLVQEATFLSSGMDQNDEATDIVWDPYNSTQLLVTGSSASAGFHTVTKDSSGNVLESWGGSWGTDLFASSIEIAADSSTPFKTNWAYTIGSGGVDRGGKIAYGPIFNYFDPNLDPDPALNYTKNKLNRHVYFTGTLGRTNTAKGQEDLNRAGGYTRDRSVLLKIDPNPNTNANQRITITFDVTMTQNQNWTEEWISSVNSNSDPTIITPISPSLVTRDPHDAFTLGPLAGDPRNARESPEDQDPSIPRIFVSTPTQKPTSYRYFSFFSYEGCKTEAPFNQTYGCTRGTQLPRRGATPLHDYTLHDIWPTSTKELPGGVFLNAMVLHPTRYTILNAGTVDGLYYDGVSKSDDDNSGNNSDIVIQELDPLTSSITDPVYLDQK